jgi:hypothetical protein
MTILFPNPSRSFDSLKKRVTFWGYDSVIEVSFSVEEAALQKLYPNMIDTEAGFLNAFDFALKKIHKVAEYAYSKGPQKGNFSYNLAADDF